ncbi:hypothetical protein BV22DRAFT_1028706 [Leucogyrophana mollusca]|uniref:Uncharacterized protein n=1 Tax=Leucogyrophana mollusca TaxID=85980 RepID=A0ACB8BXA0_9AGAM|nr:hypothetical protein BV22DRAFT_1028706 [Leucogyrophana mollusca]
MSFLVPSQRGLDHVTQQDLGDFSPINNHPSRLHMPLSPYEAYSHQPMPSVSTATTASSFVTDYMTPNLPKVGETRCYWALLSSELDYIYLDPVLASHLEDQADLLIGKSLLSFVHPEEQASAQVDLREALEKRTMHGSVTRVRYCRLSRVRRILGHNGPGHSWNEADKIAFDANYMAVDIVISWAAEGLVLCFLHAVVDLGPGDNDEHHRTPWTNWCGTPFMGPHQISLVYNQLETYCPPQGPTTQVFQILSNTDQTVNRLLLSWPPDTNHEYSHKPAAKDFAKRADDVQPTTNDNNAKTSCTRRWRIFGTMPSVGGDVDSVFIPHGTIMFACHTIHSSSRSPPAAFSSTHPVYRQSEGYPAHQTHHRPQEVSTAHYTSSPVSSPSPSYAHFVPHSHQSTASVYSPPPWSQSNDSSSTLSQYNRWSSDSPAHSMSSLPTSTSCTIRDSSFTAQSSYRPSHSPIYPEARNAPGIYPSTASPECDYRARSGNEDASMSTLAPDVVPPPRHRIGAGSARESSARHSNRPIGVLRCTSCKTDHSPEWRKGPSGKKELCNACGLRYARSRAKKEGHVATNQRRKKDKVSTTAKEEPTVAPTPPIPVPTHAIRRGGYEGGASFTSTSSAGSGSGSEAYSHHSASGVEDLKPSPSSSTSGLNFVHYSVPPPPPPAGHFSHGRSDNRSQYMHPSGPFYPTSSPLSNFPQPRAQRSHDESSGPGSRLGSYHQYPGSSSSVSHSPLTSTMAPASFEREKMEDRDLPLVERKFPRSTMSTHS